MRERAKAVEAEEEKQKLRGQVLGKKVDGPDVNAFLRQLGPDSKAVRFHVDIYACGESEILCNEAGYVELLLHVW